MTAVRPKTPRLYDSGYLKWLRQKPCCACSRFPPSEAAHIRYGLTGMQRKPDDCRAVPLCAWCHREGPEAQHKGDEQEFWARLEIDPLALATNLYAEYGGAGGAPRKPRSIKPRLPKDKRSKIQSAGFPKKKQKFRSYHAIGRDRYGR